MTSHPHCTYTAAVDAFGHLHVLVAPDANALAAVATDTATRPGSRFQRPVHDERARNPPVPVKIVGRNTAKNGGRNRDAPSGTVKMMMMAAGLIDSNVWFHRAAERAPRPRGRVRLTAPARLATTMPVLRTTQDVERFVARQVHGEAAAAAAAAAKAAAGKRRRGGLLQMPPPLQYYHAVTGVHLVNEEYALTGVNDDFDAAHAADVLVRVAT